MVESFEEKLLEIVKGNILRVLVEQTTGEERINRIRELSKEKIIPEVWEKKPIEFFSIGIEELKEEELIEQIAKEEIKITEKGRQEAKELTTCHSLIEDFFLEEYTEEEAHNIAHILEHIISNEVIENLERIDELKGYGIPLTEIPTTKGIICQLQFENPALAERIISMGVCPGQRITIMSKMKSGIVVRLRQTMLAIDYDIAKGIMVAIE
jgi:Fe2+ transport system protein FeoA